MNVTVSTTVLAPLAEVWRAQTSTEDIMATGRQRNGDIRVGINALGRAAANGMTRDLGQFSRLRTAAAWLAPLIVHTMRNAAVCPERAPSALTLRPTRQSTLVPSAVGEFVR